MGQPARLAGWGSSRRKRRWQLLAAALALPAGAALLAGCCCGLDYTTAREVIDEAQPPVALEPPVPPRDGLTRLVMRNVRLRQADTFVLEIRDLFGEMVGLGADHIPVFGDAKSYEVRVREAEVAMSADSLTGLLNNHVFAYPGAPLRHLRVTFTDDGRLRQQGILHKVVDIPFTIVAEVQITDDGKLRLHPVETKIGGIDGSGLMKALGIEMEDLLDLSGAEGMRVDGNDLLLDPEIALPPPRMVGRLAAVAVRDGLLVQWLRAKPGAPPLARPPAPPEPETPNFMHLYGGVVRFGRLFMVATNLQIADADPRDPLEFYPTYFDNQLAAGYSRSHLDDSLTTYVPDFSAVGKTLEPGERVAAPGASPGG